MLQTYSNILAAHDVMSAIIDNQLLVVDEKYNTITNTWESTQINATNWTPSQLYIYLGY